MKAETAYARVPGAGPTRVRRFRWLLFVSVAVCVAATSGVLQAAPAAAANPLTFTVTPSSGPGGLVPVARSIEPCPTVDGTNVDPSVWVTVIGTTERYYASVADDGSWSVRLTQNPFLTIGLHVLNATCRLNTSNFTYESSVYETTAPQPQVALTPASMRPGGILQMTSTTPCPEVTPATKAYPTVYAKPPGASYEWTLIYGGAETTVDPDGLWSISIDTSRYQADPMQTEGVYAAEVECRDSSDDWAYPTMFYARSNSITVSATDTPPPPPPSVDPTVINMVGLGDSYSSGEANKPFDKGTDIIGNRCHRSVYSWQRVVGVPKAAHFACSGAKIEHLTTVGQSRTGPDTISQIDQVKSYRKVLQAKGQDVDRVMLTISGNDVGFAAIIGDCVVRECLAHFPDNEAAVDDQYQRIVETLNLIVDAAPRAKIYLVGYPRLFPSQQEAQTTCGWLTPTERIRANTLSARLNRAQRLAAEEAGANFIDVIDSMDRHELCTKDSWFYPVTPQKYFKDQQQGHPRTKGQDAIAKIVFNAMNKT